MSNDLEMELKELIKRREILQKDASILTEQIRAIQFSLIFERFHVTEGTLVKVRGGKFYKVFWIGLHGDGLQKPWVRGHLQKKDGTLSKQTRHLFDDWELI